MQEFKEFLIVVSITIATMLLITYITVAIANQINTPMDIARIEQLRKDMENIKSSNSEDVIGQATQQNQIIVEKQIWNKTLFGDFLVPDVWDTVKLIEIPKEKQ